VCRCNTGVLRRQRHNNDTDSLQYTYAMVASRCACRRPLPTYLSLAMCSDAVLVIKTHGDIARCAGARSDETQPAAIAGTLANDAWSLRPRERRRHTFVG
jgi:hypothetical protein